MLRRALAVLPQLTLVLPLVALGLGRPAQAQPDHPSTAAPPASAPVSASELSMTPGVVCQKVEGYDRVTPIPDGAVTNLDKLKVYFCPLHYKVETDLKQAKPYRVRFTQDGRVRRKGDKTPLAKEDKLLEYEGRFETSDERVYLVNVVGLDQFPPGDYEFDITLHDEIDGRAVARQTVPFRIIPVAAATPASESKPAPPPPPAPTTSKAPKAKAKPGRPARRPG